MSTERYKMPVAVHLFLMRDDEILLLRRYNTGYEDGNYSVIAGHIDAGEDFISAMIREASEEAGIIILREDMVPIQVMHRKQEFEERIDYFFISRKWQGELKNMEPNKCDELKWVNINKLPKNTISYIKYAIKCYLKDDKFTLFDWNYLP